MVFINKLADHSHHDDLRVDDELVCKNLRLPTNATVTGLTVNHIQGLSDSLGNLTIDESALLADVNTQIAGKADASSVYTQTELDTIHATFAPASTTYTKTQVDAGLTAKLDATTYNSGIIQKADVTDLTALQTTVSGKANQSDVDTSLALKADLSTVNTSLDTKLDTSIFNTQIATKADLSSLQATNTTLTQKANQSDVDTSLALKADLSALNSTNTTLTTKANITDMNSALALKVDTTDFNTLTATVNTKAPQTSLDTLTATVNSKASQSSVDALSTTVDSKADTTDLDAKADTTSVYTQSEITTLLAGKVDTDATLVQSENNEIIIPQRGIPYPPKNITIPSGNYGGGQNYWSSTAWAPSWTISASDFTKVNGLRRKTYGTGSYALSNMTHENTFLPTPDQRFVELTLPYAVVATGVEAVQADELTNIYNSFPEVPNGWETFAWDATNSTWVEMNMDNTRIFPDGSPGTLPTTFREISGNTLSSNKYRVMVCEDEVATRFDGFRIYSKDESPPAIPLADVIESLIELNTFH
jgi:hypothetical protein